MEAAIALCLFTCRVEQTEQHPVVEQDVTRTGGGKLFIAGTAAISIEPVSCPAKAKGVNSSYTELYRSYPQCLPAERVGEKNTTSYLGCDYSKWV